MVCTVLNVTMTCLEATNSNRRHYILTHPMGVAMNATPIQLAIVFIRSQQQPMLCTSATALIKLVHPDSLLNCPTDQTYTIRHFVFVHC